MRLFLRLIFLLALLPVSFTACVRTVAKQPDNNYQYSSFRDIPGVTEDEIKAIEELQKQIDSRTPLIFGSPPSSEAFFDEEGNLGGFSVLLCDWLTAFFDIPFKAEINDLSSVLEKLKTGEVSFGVLTSSEERLRTYYMSAPIIRRSTKVMRIRGRPSPAEIVLSRPVRYVFTEGATLIDTVNAVLEPGSYEIAIAKDHETVYQMLNNGEADVFIGINTVETAFDSYGSIVTDDFLPLIINSVSLTAQNPALEPIISVVTKALAAGAYTRLTELYRQGYRDYRKNKFLMHLSGEEKAYIRNTPVIPFVAQFMSYPISFYSVNEKKWDGIIFDILDEMEKLAGFKFELVNDEKAEIPELINLLETGTAYTMPNLIQSEERENKFIWPDAVYLTDRFALLSKRSYPDIELSDIPFTRVGFAEGSAFADLFRNWFPNAMYAIEFPGTDDAFMALERDEVDLVMSSESRLAALTNYYEFSDYKANYLFNAAFDSSFGFNKDQAVLCSIIDKALPLIDTDRIVEQWMSRTYNIETMRLREQRPWLLGSLVLILCVLALLAILFARSRRAGKLLENIVKDRTHALELQTAKLQSIFDSLPDIVFCKDMDLRYTQINKVSEEYTGIKEADIIGKNDLESGRFPPDAAQRIMEADRIVLKENRKTIMEETLPYYDGVMRTLETIRAPLMQDRVTAGLIVIARDITGRKKVERELEVQTAMLTTLFDSIPDLIFTMDTSLRFTHCNKSFLEHFGFSMEDIVNKGEDGLGNSAKLAEERNTWNRKVIEECRTFVLEERVPRIDGTLPFYETLKAPLLLDGKTIGLLGVARNITERKEMERELSMQTALITTLFDSIPDFIFAKDVNFCYMQCNKSFLAHLGFSREDVIGKDDIEGFKLDPKLVEGYRAWDRKVINEKQRLRLEERIPGINGTNPLYETVKAPLVIDGKVIGVLGISHNITHYKEMEEEARAASRLKSAFLANMSHEIRTPMNSIMGFSELAMDDAVSPKTKEYLSKIQINAEWLLQIINDILDISKIESGKMELENIPFDMHELFENCRTLIIPKAAEKGIMLHFYAEPSVGQRPLGDPTRLRQILVNLLSNAVKFTNSGTVKVLTEIKEKSEKTVTMHFEIKDSGIGMTAEQIEKIFDPFMQAETGTTRQYGGTGLGLSITKNMVELMGGKLFVESIPGIGSKFSFDLTFDTIDVNDNEAFEKEVVLDEIEKPFFEGEILLCEDNVMNQQVICEHLSRVGIKTEVADNGMIGLQRVKERKREGAKQYDLIFMDIHMPVMDGVEASVKIIELETGVPIVAMTANIMSNDVEIYKKSGMSDCIGKPFTSQELWRCLLKYMTPVIRDGKEKNMQIEKDMKFQKELKLLFVRTNQEKYQEIEKALEKGDISLANRLAHNLKTNAGQIKKFDLQQAAGIVEKMLKDGKNQVTAEQMKKLNTELKKVLEELKKLPEETAAQTEEIKVSALSPEKVKELFDKLEPPLHRGDPESLKLIDELRMIEGSDLLIKQMEDFKFEEALATLAKLKKKLSMQ